MMVIDKENIEMHLMMLSDGELDEREIKVVMDFLNNHPEYQEILDDFQKVKLSTESILFPEIELLYKERIDTNVIVKPHSLKQQVYAYLNWKTISSAAAILLMAIFTTVLFINNDMPDEVEVTIASEQSNKMLQNVTEQTDDSHLPMLEHNKHKSESVVILQQTKRKSLIAANDAPITISKPQIVEKTIVVEGRNEQPTVAIENPFNDNGNSNVVAVQDVTQNNPTVDNTYAKENRLEQYPLVKEASEHLKEKVELAKNIVSELNNTSIQFAFGNKRIKIK